jgi:hypothetical protein
MRTLPAIKNAIVEDYDDDLPRRDYAEVMHGGQPTQSYIHM